MLNRKLAAAFVASALALAIAPAAGAHQPFREPIDVESQILPACSFDVLVTPDARREILTIFDSGRLTIHTNGRPTLTNMETGDSKTYRLRYIYQQTVDPETGEILGQVTGRSLFFIAPGDVGPSGEVDPDGGMVQIVGELRTVMDPDTFAITSFTTRGIVTDLCADLAP